MSDLVKLEQRIDKKIDKAVADISEVIQDFAGHVEKRFDAIDVRFAEMNSNIIKLQKDMRSVLNRLDSIEKDIQITEDEQLVMGMQLTRLHNWVEQAASRIGIEFPR